jgi:hypothetical protein
VVEVDALVGVEVFQSQAVLYPLSFLVEVEAEVYLDK